MSGQQLTPAYSASQMDPFVVRNGVIDVRDREVPIRELFQQINAGVLNGHLEKLVLINVTFTNNPNGVSGSNEREYDLLLTEFKGVLELRKSWNNGKFLVEITVENPQVDPKDKDQLGKLLEAFKLMDKKFHDDLERITTVRPKPTPN